MAASLLFGEYFGHVHRSAPRRHSPPSGKARGQQLTCTYEPDVWILD